MKLRSCFSQNRKLVGVEVVGTGFVLQKMLSNGRITVNFCWSLFAISLWLEFLLLVSGSNTFGDMLIDSILQSLGCTAHVPTITVAHVLIHDHTLLCGGQDILMDSRKNLLSRKNDAWIYCSITLINCWFGKFFKFLRHFANPWEPKVDGWKTVEKITIIFRLGFILITLNVMLYLWPSLHRRSQGGPGGPPPPSN